MATGGEGVAALHGREAALKEFDDTKVGVKGLVDSGITSVPSIFHHPNLHISSSSSSPHHLSIPTVDLSLPHAVAVALVRDAAHRWGFFQLVNHDIPLSTIEQTISAVRSFHELPAEARSAYYSRDRASSFRYFSNFDLFRSTAASWRDTLQLGPVRPDPEQIPAVCREQLLAWDKHVADVGRSVMGLLCEGLGVTAESLEEMTCLEMRTTVCQYYPPCPEPDQTVGIATHTDPSALTVLVQDHIGGLQVRGKGEDGVEAWVDVKPLPGALIINVGDLFQIISNDEYKSVEHRVVANPHQEARVSVVTFFNPGKRGDSDLYGPLPELISPDKPALYRNFTIADYMKAFFSKELNTKHLVDHFKPMTDGE